MAKATNKQLIAQNLDIASRTGMTFASRLDALERADEIFARTKKPWSYFGYDHSPTVELGQIVSSQYAEAITKPGFNDPNGNFSYDQFTEARARIAGMTPHNHAHWMIANGIDAQLADGTIIEFKTHQIDMRRRKVHPVVRIWRKLFGSRNGETR